MNTHTGSSMIPFENIINTRVSAGAVVRAEGILAQGWSAPGYEAIDLAKAIPWQLQNHEQRSHNFHIQCLDMLDPLLRAHSQTSDDKYLKVSLPITLDWIQQHSDPQATGISPFAWYDMSVGMRAYRLAYLFQAGEHAGLLDGAARQPIWSSLEQHAIYLADDKNIAFHNNHGYYQIAGQIAMGRRFADKSPVMAQAVEQGNVRLKRMLEQQFAPDGVHREHSPDYHRMVCDTLKALIDAGLVKDQETIAFALRIEEALSWFVLPNQHIVNFGDSDDRLLARQPKEAEHKWSTPEMRFWVSGGKIGKASEQIFRAFRDGGYWVARKPGSDVHDLGSYSYLALNAAFHSRTHKHADDLSFVWSDQGKNILVDAGRYGYIGKAEQGSALWLDGYWYSDPHRVYVESTRAHNTLEFDGLNFPRKGAAPYGSALRRWGSDNSGMMFVEAECKHFKSIRHARVLFFMPAQWLVVFDWFHDNANAPHSVKQWFHVGHELQVLEDQGQYLIFVPASPQPLRIASLLPEPAASRLYIGEKEPFSQGWWSRKELDAVPNYAFNFELRDAITGIFATVFCFSNTLTLDQEWSKVNISGRKGQLRWRSDNKAHQLYFERPENAEMLVTYISNDAHI